MGRISGNVRNTGHNKDGGRLSEVEDYIRKSDFEYGVLYDKKGNVINSFAGDENKVETDRGDAMKAEDGIFTHNHPDDGGYIYPLSRDDIEFAIYYNLKELRAVTPNGYVFSLRRRSGDNMWLDKSGFPVGYADIREEYNKIEGRFKRYIDKAKTEKEKNERLAVMFHATNIQLSKKYGWDYSVRKVYKGKKTKTKDTDITTYNKAFYLLRKYIK